MLRALCKQVIQCQNALNTMQIAYLSSKTLQILYEKEISAAKNTQSRDFMRFPQTVWHTDLR